MATRRDLLAALGGTAAMAGFGGCLSVFSGSNDNSEADIYPPKGPELDDELLTSVADPSLQVPVQFFSGYQHRLPELRENYDLTAVVPRLGGEFLSVLETDIDGAAAADCERVVGSNYYALWSTGPFGDPVPSGQTIHVTGDFAQDPFVEWLESVDGYQSIGSEQSAERYVADIVDGNGFESWAVRDGLVVLLSRTDVTSRTERYDTNEEAASEALALEFDQIERDDAPIANSAPEFAETVQALDDGPIRAGTEYALIPQGADTGTDSFDDVIANIVSGGVSVQTGSEPALQRAVSYLEPEMADSSRLRSAYSASEMTTVPVDQWSFSVDGRVAQARGAVEEPPGRDALRAVLPVPGYKDYSRRIIPEDLNRTPNPQAIFDGDVADDRIELSHTSGETVENLRVRYVQDGSVSYEAWTGPVDQGDSFRSSGEPDSGTQVWLTWRPETTDAAVLLRFRTE